MKRLTLTLILVIVLTLIQNLIHLHREAQLATAAERWRDNAMAWRDAYEANRDEKLVREYYENLPSRL